VLESALERNGNVKDNMTDNMTKSHDKN